MNIVFAEIDPQSWTFKSHHVFEVGGNGKRIEKNWTFFFYKGRLHLIYKTHPLEIHKLDFYLDPQTVTMTDRKEFPYSDNYKNIWEFGHLRGGSCPVMFEGEYLKVFHSSFDASDTKRRIYVSGFMTFEMTPPFRVTRMTRLPVLFGSSCDQNMSWMPLVAFPCGAVLEGDDLLISCGVNDCFNAIVKFSRDEILNRLENVC
jgi:predicted GH43/DUF377 family glycosyl hydrolase